MALIKRERGALTPTMKSKKTESTPSSAYALPTKKSTPVAELLGYILLLFGEKKIGKTTLLAEGGDRTFFAFFEPGGKSLELYGDVFPTWTTFRLAVTQIIASKRFDHVVIDTVDRAYKASEKFTLKRLNITHASDEAYGKGWAAQRDDFEEPIMRLVNHGIAVTFVSHADERELKRMDGTTYDRIGPTMPKQARELIEGLVDIWAYYGYDSGRRVLYIQGDEHLGAGHRLVKHFRTPSGTPLRTIDMGASPEEAFKNFHDAFHNRYIPVDRTASPRDEEDAPKKKPTAFKRKLLKGK